MFLGKLTKGNMVTLNENKNDNIMNDNKKGLQKYHKKREQKIIAGNNNKNDNT
jgi:hypothetical protein